MKKIILAFLVIAMLFTSLISCGGAVEYKDDVSVTALADCKVTLLDCDTEKAVSDKVALKAGERLFITCAIPEGIPAYKIRLDIGEETSTFTVAYDGRGETNVWFLTADTYK